MWHSLCHVICASSATVLRNITLNYKGVCRAAPGKTNGSGKGKLLFSSVEQIKAIVICKEEEGLKSLDCIYFVYLNWFWSLCIPGICSGHQSFHTSHHSSSRDQPQRNIVYIHWRIIFIYLIFISFWITLARPAIIKGVLRTASSVWMPGILAWGFRSFVGGWRMEDRLWPRGRKEEGGWRREEEGEHHTSCITHHTSYMVFKIFSFTRYYRSKYWWRSTIHENWSWKGLPSIFLMTISSWTIRTPTLNATLVKPKILLQKQNFSKT